MVAAGARGRWAEVDDAESLVLPSDWFGRRLFVLGIIEATAMKGSWKLGEGLLSCSSKLINRRRKMRFRRAHFILGTLVVLSIATSAVASVDSAKMQIASGDFDGALRSLEDLDSPEPEVIFLRAVVLAEIGRGTEAERMFRDLIDRYPDYPEPYNNLAVLLAGSGRFEEAVETLKGALRTHPSYRTAWDNLTTIYGRLASEAYSRALDVDSAGRAAPVKLALLGSLSRAEEAVMGPVETIPAVAVAEHPQATGEQESVAQSQRPAAPVKAAPVKTDEIASPAESAADDSTQVAGATVSDEDALAAVVEEVVAEAAEEAPVEPIDFEVAAETVPAMAELEVAEAEPSPAELTGLIEAWAAAWSGQRPDDYLSFYSSSFTPNDGMGLAEWQSLRRSRLEAPDYVRVSVALLDYEFDGDQARVVFNQSYESNTFSDLVTKTLALIREDGTWKIVRETVGS
jgi:hypothetical protein